MKGVHRTTIGGLELDLRGDKTAFLPLNSTLLVSDLHLGKASHFRKEGIAIPKAAEMNNLVRLQRAIEACKPKNILFLGDLFHSNYNETWELFAAFRQQFASIDFKLIVGNHDILPDVHYQRAGINIIGHSLKMGEVLFTHEPEADRISTVYNIAGHVHPKVRLSGKGGQAVTIPCFYFGKSQGLLPAFGTFTGGYKIKPVKGDRVFGVADELVFDLSST